MVRRASDEQIHFGSKYHHLFWKSASLNKIAQRESEGGEVLREKKANLGRSVFAARVGVVGRLDLVTSILLLVGAAHELCNNMPAVPGGIDPGRRSLAGE